MNQRHSANWLGRMSRPLIWTIHGGIFAFSGIAAFLLRFDLSIPREEIVQMAYALPVWVVLKSIAFRAVKLDRGWWQFVSLDDVPRLVVANMIGSLLAAPVVLWITPPGFPRSIYFVDLLVCSFLTGGVRLAVHTFVEASKLHVSADKSRTLIYGAGDTGVSLLAEIRRASTLPYHAVGFIDDNPQKAGLAIHGAKVLGNGEGLAAVAKRHQIDTVLIAVPSASSEQMVQMVCRCQQARVSFKTVLGLGEVIERNGLAKQIRDVAVEDLLGRRPVQLDVAAITEKLEGKVVLVTGAAGSIGSELCRQIARFRPEAIVGYEISETALFHLDLEMKERFPGVPFYPVMGSIQEPRRLSEVMDGYRPSILYHAAAYKHVPMMEANPFEALENNVLGTYATALVSEEHGIEDFVMISTDKAVRPTSIMGATKRVAELAVNSLQNGRTRFESVRFGNVLGSNGSVVALFKQQIAAGGPVRVTHPDMQRYFMTIPEASQLVLLASTMGIGGEIFVLDMGEPVKIVDLARNLILLSGLRPDDDIRIEFTGVRPGEKLNEELRAIEESTAPTRHEKVKVFVGPSVGYEEMREHIETLRQVCAARDVADLILRFKEIVPEYNPSSHVLRRALAHVGPREQKRRAAMAATG